MPHLLPVLHLRKADAVIGVITMVVAGPLAYLRKQIIHPVTLLVFLTLIVAFRHQSLREALLQLLPVYLVLKALFAREQVVIVLPRLQEELLPVPAVLHRVLLVLIGIVLTIPANSSASKLASPTKTPLISGCSTNDFTFSAVTLPP